MVLVFRQVCHQGVVEQLQHLYLNFYVLHGNTATFLRGGENNDIYFADNSLLLPTVKGSSKSIKS